MELSPRDQFPVFSSKSYATSPGPSPATTLISVLRGARILIEPRQVEVKIIVLEEASVNCRNMWF